jgi:AmiR/NasT family two-component response regulator
MDEGRILIAMASESLISKIKTVLTEGGYIVVDSAKDGDECLRKARLLKPDVTIIDGTIQPFNTNQPARYLIEDNICDVIMFAGADQEEAICDIKGEGNFSILAKPINRQMLLGIIDLMIKNRKRLKKLEKEVTELRTMLDTRKEVEKAKGLLMRNLGLSEAEAFKRIQKQSMDRGISMKEIAKAVILAYDI